MHSSFWGLCLSFVFLLSPTAIQPQAAITQTSKDSRGTLPGLPAVAQHRSVFKKIGREAHIDPLLLMAIALTESGCSGRESVHTCRPTAWAIRLPKGPVFPKSRIEAEVRLQSELPRTKLIDVGLMQINVKWNGHRVADPADLLDPETNVRTAAKILTDCMRLSPRNVIKAVGLYHSRAPCKYIPYSRQVFRTYRKLNRYRSVLDLLD